MNTIKTLFKCLILSQIVFLNLISANQADNQQDVPENVVVVLDQTLSLKNLDELEFKVQVHEGFFSYLDKFSLEIEGLSITELKFDPIVTFFDKTFQKNKEGLKGIATGKAKVKITNLQSPFDESQKLNVKLNYQACTTEYCLFPQTYEYNHQLTADQSKFLNQLKSPKWMNNGFLYSLFFIFLAGLLTSLTPCVYPLIPITIAVLGRQKSDTKMKGFIKSTIYVLGLAFTYSILGVFAATSGFMFGSLLSNIYFLAFLSLVLFIAALSMFDVLEIKSPQFLNKYNTGNKNSYLGIFISGAFSGLVVGPCVGPVLIGVLSYISMTKDIFTGFGFMFAFALGLGSLIIVLGTFSSLIDKIPKSGQWMNVVKKSLSFVFLLMIAYFLKPILDIRTLFIVFSLILAIFSAIVIYKNLNSGPSLELSIFKALCMFSLLVVLLSSLLNQERFERFVGYNSSTFANTQWEVFSEDKLLKAKENGQIVILDFYADWCPACKELKHKTFADPRVLNYSKNIKWFYFDSTKPTAQLDIYKKKYSILGLPTILLFNTKGDLRSDLTLTGYEDAERFVERLKKLDSL